MESRYRQYVYEIVASFFMPTFMKLCLFSTINTHHIYPRLFLSIPTRPPIVGCEVPHTHTVPMWADLASTAQGEPLGK